MLFSATMPEPIKKLAKKILNEPKFISVTPQNITTNEDIEQHYYVIEEHERDDAIIRLLDSLEPQKSIIFCRMKKEVDRLTTKLIASGFIAKGLHGDMDQSAREETIKAFRSSSINILIATDVAARGINIKDISHVFNYHIPFDPDSYVHRIGRTGRAGQKGTAITLLTPIEFNSLSKISKNVGVKVIQKQIPSLNELKVSSLKKTANIIKKVHIDDASIKILSALEEEMDLTQIACKAISLLINKDGLKGPESIGLDSKTFEKIVKDFKAKEEEKRQGNRRKRDGRSSNRRKAYDDNKSSGKDKRKSEKSYSNKKDDKRSSNRKRDDNKSRSKR